MGEKLTIFRNELKYLMDILTAQQLQTEIQKFMIADGHMSDMGYRVKSLYFDTINNLDYYDKENSVYAKKKLRLRIYAENSEIIKLECKEKVGTLQHKTSLLITKKEAEAMLNSEYSFLLTRKEKEACRLYTILMLGSYRPVVMIEYNRKAYTYPEFNTRITFDSDVKFSEINMNIFDRNIVYDYALDSNIILEVKYNEKLVRYLKKILSNKKLNRISYSKYEHCRSLLR